MKHIKLKTLTGIKWNGIGQVARQVLQFVITVCLARILNPKDFGLLGMVIVFGGFAHLFSDMGLGMALIQRQQIEERHISSIFWINIITGCFIALVLIMLSGVIARFYNEPVLKTCVIWISFNFIIGAFKVVQNALLEKQMKFKAIAIIETIAVFCSGAIAIGLALNGFGIYSLVMQTLILTLVSSVLLWLSSDWRPKLLFDGKSIRELWRFSSNLLGFNIFNYWARNLDNLLIGRFIGSAELGIYSRAYNLMMLPIHQVNNIISRVVFPALSAIQDDLLRVKNIYLKFTRAIALLSFPLMLGLFVVADSFIVGIFGIKWAAVIPILRLFCLTGMLQSIGTTVGWIYNSQGRTDIQLRWGIFAGCVRGIVFVIGLKWGILGVACAYVISSYGILFAPSIIIPGRLIHLRFGEMMRNLFSPFASALVMALMVLGVSFVIPARWPVLMHLLIQVLTGIMVYLGIIHGFKLKAYQEVRDILLK